MPKELRDYQEILSNAVRIAIAKYRKVLLQLDTGGGKTVIATDIILRAIKAGKRVVFLTDRKKILSQTFKTVTDFGIQCESFEATSSVIYVSKCYICMAETFFRRFSRGWFKDIKIDLVVIDEAHSGIFSKIVELFPNEYVVGMTATPVSTGGLPLNKLYNKIILGPKKSEMIENGFLVPSIDIGHNQMLDLLKQAGEFTPASQMLQFTQKHIDDRMQKLWARHAGNRQTIIFNINVEHNNKIVKSFKDQGIECEGVDAKSKNREDVEKEFEKGNIQILCNVGIHTKGSDFPKVSCIVLNHSTMSLSKYIQEVGRGGRPSENKKDFILLDMGNNVMRHGSYNDDIDWLELFNNDGLDRDDKLKKKYKLCPVCYAYIQNNYITNCHVCNTTLSPSQLLSLESQMPKNLIGKDPKNMTWNELKEYGKYKQYSPRWAYMQRYGNKYKK